VAALTQVLFVPYLRRRIVDREDLRPWHMLYTPLVPKQPRIKEVPTSASDADESDHAAFAVAAAASGHVVDTATVFPVAAGSEEARSVDVGAEWRIEDPPAAASTSGSSPADLPHAVSTQELVTNPVSGRPPAPTAAHGAAPSRRSPARTDDLENTTLAAVWAASAGKPAAARAAAVARYWFMFGQQREIRHYRHEEVADFHDRSTRYHERVEELFSYLQVSERGWVGGVGGCLCATLARRLVGPLLPCA
jgi:hypothetical protein